MKGRRGSGVKGAEGRFANALEILFNEMAAEGWTYERAETLPSISRQGMFRRSVETYSNILVFSRPTSEIIEIEPKIEETPLPEEPAVTIKKTPSSPNVVEKEETVQEEDKES
jgi:hypothetical protein